MKETINTIISTLALGISVLTAWLTLLRKGKLKMTPPTPLLLGYEEGKAKISFFTMLYSSAFRGQVVESMYVILKQDGKKHLFNRWAYVYESHAYASGCYVKPEGVAQNHQFYILDYNFIFQPGKVQIDIYARLAPKKKDALLKTIQLQIPIEKKSECENKIKGIMFEWEPDKKNYSLRIDKNPEETMLKILKQLTRNNSGKSFFGY